VRRTFTSVPIVLIVSVSWTFAWRMTQYYLDPQACNMDMRVGHGDFQDQNTTSFFDSMANVGVIGFILLVEFLFVPWMTSRGKKFGLLPRLAIGVVLMAASALTALILEVVRRNQSALAPGDWSSSAPFSVRFPGVANLTDPTIVKALDPWMGTCIVDGVDYCSNCNSGMVEGVKVGIYMSDISAYWMVVPTLLMGFSEALVNPGIRYYAYEVTPAPARALVQGLTLVFFGAQPEAMVAVANKLLHPFVNYNLNITHNVFGIAMGIEIFYCLTLIACAIAVPFLWLYQRLSHVEVDNLVELAQSQDSLVE